MTRHSTQMGESTYGPPDLGRFRLKRTAGVAERRTCVFVTGLSVMRLFCVRQCLQK